MIPTNLDEAQSELHRARLATDAFRTLVEAQIETINALSAKVKDLEAQLSAESDKYKAIAELKQIVAPGATFSVKYSYWRHGERDPSSKEVTDWAVAVIDLTLGGWSVTFQEMSESLPELVEKCRAHFANTQLEAV